MLLTYKIKHNRDFSEELRKARKVVEFCIAHRTHNRTHNQPSTLRPGSSDHYPSFSSVTSPASSSVFSPSFSSVTSPASSSVSLPEEDSFSCKESLFPVDVRHIGLKSTLSGPIIRKYSRNQDIKSVRNVKLIIPSRAVRVDMEEKTLQISCLKLQLDYHFSNNFKKISQIEIDSVYAYVAVVFSDEKPESAGNYIGVDRNTRGHIAVVADPDSGKVWKLGKMRYHTHKKYENIKRRLYSEGKHISLKAVKNREKNIVKDLNHKISRKIVDLALYTGCGIKLENFKSVRKFNSRVESTEKGSKNKIEVKKKSQKGEKSSIRSKSEEISKRISNVETTKRNETKSKNKNKSENKHNNNNKSENKHNNNNKSENNNKNKAKKSIWSNEYSLNSWSFHQLEQFIEYKARLQGVEVVYIDPHATSKRCSICGHTGNRHSKQFECPHCGHVDHADVNAAFNIALTPEGSGQFSAERDAEKGSTDTPQKILARKLPSKRIAGEKTSPHFAWEVCQFLA